MPGGPALSIERNEVLVGPKRKRALLSRVLMRHDRRSRSAAYQNRGIGLPLLHRSWHNAVHANSLAQRSRDRTCGRSGACWARGLVTTPLSVYLPFNRDCLGATFVPAKRGATPP